MVLGSVKRTFTFLSSGNLEEKLIILMIQTFCLFCWEISKLAFLYSYRFLKYGFEKRGFLLKSLRNNKHSTLTDQKEKSK
jgi:hypothetical protein